MARKLLTDLIIDTINRGKKHNITPEEIIIIIETFCKTIEQRQIMDAYNTGKVFPQDEALDYYERSYDNVNEN